MTPRPLPPWERKKKGREKKALTQQIGTTLQSQMQSERNGLHLRTSAADALRERNRQPREFGRAGPVSEGLKFECKPSFFGLMVFFLLHLSLKVRK